MTKGSVKDRLYKDALVTVDKIFESDRLSNEESIKELSDLKTQIELRINLLKEIDKGNDDERIL
ncbi:MAG: hypothetical protein HYS25_00915 [Ignavibacteriales bacterium]|nr:hypothetical protein [Ignavibacteriales bacterium]